MVVFRIMQCHSSFVQAGVDKVSRPFGGCQATVVSGRTTKTRNFGLDSVLIMYEFKCTVDVWGEEKSSILCEREREREREREKEREREMQHCRL